MSAEDLKKLGQEVEQLKRVWCKEVIEFYMKKKRDHFVGCCPFHNEKTPSLVFYIWEEYFNCFGCGRTGHMLELAQGYSK